MAEDVRATLLVGDDCDTVPDITLT